MKPVKNILSRAILAALLPAGVLALGAGSALAQEQDQADSDMMLEEVIVTARKVEESLQEVPVAVSALSADYMADLGITDLSDISKVTAGLVFDSEFARGANRPVIRGQANILGGSGVSYFIDGVYITGSIDDYDLNDVQRVEVVKGPQSALYGRNTYSGAINIITRSPGEEFGANARLELAEDNEWQLAASVRGPLTDTIGGSISVRHYERGGIFTNQFDGQDIGEQESNSLSGVLEFNPSERLQIRARAYWAERDDGQPAVVATRFFENNCFFDNGTLYGGAGRYFCGEVEARPINSDWPVQVPDQEDSTDTIQLSLRVDWDINDDWSLTSITGYNDVEDTFVIDGDYLPTSFHVSNFTPNGFPISGFEDGPPFNYAYVGSMTDFAFASNSTNEDISQELRFEFQGERMTALVGAYYFDQDTESRDIRNVSAAQQDLADANFFAEFLRMQGVCAANFLCESIFPLFNSTIVVPRDQNFLSTRNIAMFGLVSFDIGDAFGLTLEGRYAEEKITRRAIIQDLGGTPTATPSTSATFDNFKPRVTLDWQLTDNNMLYALYAKGTKPGGFNGTVAIEAGIPTFEEEEVDSFEIGSKNTFAGGRVVANFAAFYNDVQGYQLTQNVQSGQNTTSATVNAGDADIYGFEAEIMAQLTEGLRLTFNYAWADTEFTSGVDANQGVLNDVADNGLVDCSTGNQFPETGECTSLYGSIVGKSIPRVAEHQAFVDLEYRAPFGSGGWEWFAGANYVFESSKYAQVHNLAETGDTSLVNARVGVLNDRYSLQLYGRNLTGEDTPFNVLRYAEPEAFRRNFAISPRRDTYFGVIGSMNF